MKSIENKIVIVDPDKAAEILTNKNVTLTKRLHSKLVIKYNGNMDRELLNNIRKIRDIELSI